MAELYCSLACIAFFRDRRMRIKPGEQGPEHERPRIKFKIRDCQATILPPSLKNRQFQMRPLPVPNEFCRLELAPVIRWKGKRNHRAYEIDLGQDINFYNRDTASNRHREVNPPGSSAGRSSAHSSRRIAFKTADEPVVIMCQQILSLLTHALFQLHHLQSLPIPLKQPLFLMLCIATLCACFYIHSCNCRHMGVLIVHQC